MYQRSPVSRSPFSYCGEALTWAAIKLVKREVMTIEKSIMKAVWD